MSTLLPAVTLKILSDLQSPANILEMTDILPAGRIKQIAVIGDSEVGEDARRLAEEIGSSLALGGYAVITGGGGGIMEAASKGAAEAGGLTIGILPGTSKYQANCYCKLVIPTGMGHARNALTALAGDAIVAIGGGAGTLSEICFGWIYQKPIFVFKEYGGWSKKLAGKSVDHRLDSVIIECISVEDLMIRLRETFED